eukprot:SAG31_NODE_334_length_17513_cov_10.799989_3_plen_641_part_00
MGDVYEDQVAGGPMVDEQPLELEHAIGFTGRHARTLTAHPQQPNATIFAIGCTIVLGKLDDPHDQEFLRGHDEEISALAVAKTGQMLATGQVGSTHLKEPYAPVIVWDYARREEVYFLKGLVGRVLCVSFSSDSRFLAAADTEGNILVWSMETGLLATTVRHCPNCSTLEWGNIAEIDESRMTRHAKYMLITAHPSKCYRHMMEFDVRTMQYEMTTTPFMLPSMGLKRTYTHCVITAKDEYAMIATDQGDYAVFNIPNMIYRASVPVSSNGVLCMAQAKGHIYAGAGDGKLKKLHGEDLEWEEVAETSLAGKISSMCAVPDGSELIVGTTSGKMYRVGTIDLNTYEIADSHTGPVNDASFGERSDVFTTVSADRSCRVWDLSDYSVRCRSNVPASVPICVQMVGEESSVVGWEDGALRGFDTTNGDMIWQLVGAHRGEVTAVCTTSKLIVSGGADGGVRYWDAANRQLLTQFTEHHKAVKGLSIDVKENNLFHSCSPDNSTVTMDLKRQKRAAYHQLKGAVFNCLSQRHDSETELVTGNADGTIMFWDCDEPAPVLVWQHPSRESILSIDVSPTGRYLASAGKDQNVTIWDITAGTLIASGVCHSAPILAVKWSPDEKQVISTGEDCCICVWNFFDPAEE